MNTAIQAINVIASPSHLIVVNSIHMVTPSSYSPQINGSQCSPHWQHHQHLVKFVYGMFFLFGFQIVKILQKTEFHAIRPIAVALVSKMYILLFSWINEISNVS